MVPKALSLSERRERLEALSSAAPHGDAMVLRRGAALARLGQRHPFLFGVAVSALKTSGSDLMAQSFVERREQLDLRRNLVFFTWGLLYLGGVQYFMCRRERER